MSPGSILFYYLTAFFVVLVICSPSAPPEATDIVAVAAAAGIVVTLLAQFILGNGPNADVAKAAGKGESQRIDFPMIIRRWPTNLHTDALSRPKSRQIHHIRSQRTGNSIPLRHIR